MNSKRSGPEWKETAAAIRLRCGNRCETAGCPSERRLSVVFVDDEPTPPRHPTLGIFEGAGNCVVLCAACDGRRRRIAKRTIGGLTRAETLEALALAVKSDAARAVNLFPDKLFP